MFFGFFVLWTVMLLTLNCWHWPNVFEGMGHLHNLCFQWTVFGRCWWPEQWCWCCFRILVLQSVVVLTQRQMLLASIGASTNQTWIEWLAAEVITSTFAICFGGWFSKDWLSCCCFWFGYWREWCCWRCKDCAVAAVSGFLCCREWC